MFHGLGGVLARPEASCLLGHGPEIWRGLFCSVFTVDLFNRRSRVAIRVKRRLGILRLCVVRSKNTVLSAELAVHAPDHRMQTPPAMFCLLGSSCGPLPPACGEPPTVQYVQVHSRKTSRGKRGKKVAPGLRSSVWQPSNQGIRSTLRAGSEKKDRYDRSPCLLRKFPYCLPMHFVPDLDRVRA